MTDTQLDGEHTDFASALQASADALTQKKSLQLADKWTQKQAEQQFFELDVFAKNNITGKQAIGMAIIRATGFKFRHACDDVVWCTPTGKKPAKDKCASAVGWCRFWTPTQDARKDSRKKHGAISKWVGGAQWNLPVFDLHTPKTFTQHERDGSTTQYDATWADELTGARWWRVESAAGLPTSDAIQMPALGFEIDDGTRQEMAASIIDLVRHFAHCPTVVDSGGKSYHVFAPLAQPVDLRDVDQAAKMHDVLLLLNGVVGGDYACMDARHEFRLPSFFMPGITRTQPTIFVGRAPCFDNIDDALEIATRAYCAKFNCAADDALANARMRKHHAQTRKQIADKAKDLRAKISALDAQLEASAIAEAHCLLHAVDELATRTWATTQAEIDELIELRTALYRVSSNRTEHGMQAARRGRAKTACKLATSGNVPRHIRRYLEKVCAEIGEALKGHRNDVLTTFAFQVGQRLRDAGETSVASGIIDALTEACWCNGYAAEMSADALHKQILQCISSGMSGAHRDPNGTDADGVARIDGVRYMHARFFDKAIDGRIFKTLDPEQMLQAVTVVTGGCGIGKSEMCLSVVRKMPQDARIAVVFPRKSLITENLDRYKAEGFESYLHDDGTVRRDLSAVQRVLICIDSLRLLDGMPFDLAIIDEAASDMLACLKQDTAQDQRVTQRIFDSFRVLRELVASACEPPPTNSADDDRLCKQVILCSAVINRPMMQALKHMCGDYVPLVLTMPDDVKPYSAKKICEISERDFFKYYVTARALKLKPFVGELTKKGVESIDFVGKVLTRNAQTQQSSLQCTSTARLVGRIRDAWSDQDSVCANLAAHVGLSDTDASKKVTFVLTGAYGFNLAKAADRAMPSTFETFLQIANRIRPAELIFIVTQDGTPDGVQWLPPTKYEQEERRDFESMRQRSAPSAEMPSADDVHWFCKLRALVRESVDADKFHCVTRLFRYFEAQGATRINPPPVATLTSSMERVLKSLDIRSPKSFLRSEDVARALKQGAIKTANREFYADWLRGCYPANDPIDDMRQRIAKRGDKAEVHLENHSELWARALLYCAGYARDVEREEADAACQSQSCKVNPFKRGTLRQKVLSVLDLLEMLTVHQMQPLDADELPLDVGEQYDFGARLQQCFTVSRTNIRLDHAQRLYKRRFAVPALDSVRVNRILARYHGRAEDSPEYTPKTSEQLTRRIFEILRDVTNCAIDTCGKQGRVVIDGRKVSTFAIDEPRLFEWFAELQDGVSRFFDKTRKPVVDAQDVQIIDVDPEVIAKIEADEPVLNDASATFADAFDHPEQFAPSLDAWTGKAIASADDEGPLDSHAIIHKMARAAEEHHNDLMRKVVATWRDAADAIDDAAQHASWEDTEHDWHDATDALDLDGFFLNARFDVQSAIADAVDVLNELENVALDPERERLDYDWTYAEQRLTDDAETLRKAADEFEAECARDAIEWHRKSEEILATL